MDSLTEIVGYLASAIVMLSFLMKSMEKLRFVNAIGCAFFIIYGFLLQTSWPIIITNFFIFTINVNQIIKNRNSST